MCYLSVKTITKLSGFYVLCICVTGSQGKMSSSDTNSAIFLTDTKEAIRQKIVTQVSATCIGTTCASSKHIVCLAILNLKESISNCYIYIYINRAGFQRRTGYFKATARIGRQFRSWCKLPVAHFLFRGRQTIEKHWWRLLNRYWGILGDGENKWYLLCLFTCIEMHRFKLLVFVLSLRNLLC